MTPCAYLAGPMRGLPGFNFDAFDQAAAALRALGWTVHSPAEHDRSMGFDPSLGTLEGFDVAAAMSWDLQQVLDMECVIVLPGWEASTGCHYELSACHALGKPVFQYPELTPVELPDVVTDPVGSSKRVGGEIRVVDPETGGAKGQKATQMSTLDPVALDMLGRVGGMGAEKYDRYNYLKGYAWHLSYDAAQRHAQAFWGGEDLDPESGLPHTAHAAWHFNALTSFLVRERGTDDRPE